MKPARGRQTLRQTLTDNQKAMDGIARMMGKPTVSLGVIPDAPKPRIKRDQPVVKAVLEKDVQKAVMDMLKLHPKVAFRARFNRGVMRSTYNGKESFTQFNTMPGFSDIHGMLKGGAAFYMEVKKPIGGVISREQASFVAAVKAAGGIAGIVRSVEDALMLLL